MKINPIVIFILFLFLNLEGCSTIKRDIYFKDINSQYKDKNASVEFPGSIGWSNLLAKNNSTIGRIRIEVKNKATGNYLFGILVPVVPVFFLPANEFKLKVEKLVIRCEVENHTNFKMHGECLDVNLVLKDYKRLKPIQIINNDHNSEFIFDVLASEIKDFSVEILAFKTGTGEVLSERKRIDLTLEDWTRYHLVQIAP